MWCASCYLVVLTRLATCAHSVQPQIAERHVRATSAALGLTNALCNNRYKDNA